MLVARPLAEVLSLIDSSGCLAIEIKEAYVSCFSPSLLVGIEVHFASTDGRSVVYFL
jgi:hypothetical protein